MSKRKTRHIRVGLVSTIPTMYLAINTKAMKFRWCDSTARKGIEEVRKGNGADITSQKDLTKLLGYLKEVGSKKVVVG